MKFTVLLHLFSSFLCFTAFTQSTGGDFKADIESIILTLAPKFENEIEKEIVYRQLNGFLASVKERKGDKKWDRFIADFRKTGSIAQSMLNTYDASLYQMAGMMSNKLKKNTSGAGNPELNTKEVGEFQLITQNGSPAQCDIKYIEYLLRTYSEQLASVFFSDEKISKRYTQNIAQLKGKNLKVYIMTDKQQIKQQFAKVNGIAAALIGHEYTDSVLKLNARILFKYNELFTMSAFVHELTHFIWALSYINPEHTKPMPLVFEEAKMNELKQAFAPFSDATPLKEGIAEYMNAKFNLLYKYRLIDDVDSQLHDYFEKSGEGFDLSELAYKIYDINNDEPCYQIAHSLFGYLCRNYGYNKALELSYSMQQPEDYKEILNADFATINTNWNHYVKTYKKE